MEICSCSIVFLKKNGKAIILCIAGLTLGTILFSFAYPPWRALIIVLGGVFVLYVPGYVLSKILFPKNKSTIAIDMTQINALDFIERFALSICSSLALISLGLTLIRYLKVELTGWRVFAWIFFVNLIILIVFTLSRLGRKNHRSKE